MRYTRYNSLSDEALIREAQIHDLIVEEKNDLLVELTQRLSSCVDTIAAMQEEHDAQIDKIMGMTEDLETRVRTLRFASRR